MTFAINCFFKAAVVAASVFGFTLSAAMAVPIANTGEGFNVVASGGVVVARFEGHTAAFSNLLHLVGFTPSISTVIPLPPNPTADGRIFYNHESPVGATVDLGFHAAGEVLHFYIESYGFNGLNLLYAGAGSQNPDGHAHARVQAEWEPGRTLVSFEDLLNGPFDYNDLSFSFSNTTSAPPSSEVPLPGALPLFATGLGALGFLAYRRQRKATAA